MKTEEGGDAKPGVIGDVRNNNNSITINNNTTTSTTTANITSNGKPHTSTSSTSPNTRFTHQQSVPSASSSPTLSSCSTATATSAQSHNQSRTQTTTSSRSSRSQNNADNNASNDTGFMWECSLCTYRNSADIFKCDVCEARRGTSTRKPRTTSDNITAQVLRQQEQIRQQAIKSSTPTSASNTPSSSASRPLRGERNASLSTTRTQIVRSPDASSSKRDLKINTSQRAGSSIRSQTSSPTATNTPDIDDNESTNDTDTNLDDTDANASSSDKPSRPRKKSTSRRRSSTTARRSTVKTYYHSPVKIFPLDDGSNKFRYAPPIESGKAGIIIDKRRFTEHSITVNDVTITVTEFATRKKKEKETKRKKKKKVRRVVDPVN